MKQLLQNLPKNFIEETFVTSPNYISYLIQWVQDNGKVRGRQMIKIIGYFIFDQIFFLDQDFEFFF